MAARRLLCASPGRESGNRMARGSFSSCTRGHLQSNTIKCGVGWGASSLCVLEIKLLAGIELNLRTMTPDYHLRICPDESMFS